MTPTSPRHDTNPKRQRGPRSRFGLVCAGWCLSCLLLSGCGHALDSPGADSMPPFRDAAEETGLIFHHVNGMSVQYYLPEIVGAGVALFDYNNDGKLDVLLLQGGPLGPEHKPDRSRWPRHRLFRNDLEVQPDGRRVLRFTDVTE